MLPDDLICLLSGTPDDFVLYSRQEHSQRLIDIFLDICDPAEKRGLLLVWDAAGPVWRNVNPANPLTGSIYLHHIQDNILLSKFS